MILAESKSLGEQVRVCCYIWHLFTLSMFIFRPKSEEVTKAREIGH